jgi:hypothetical protein
MAQEKHGGIDRPQHIAGCHAKGKKRTVRLPDGSRGKLPVDLQVLQVGQAEGGAKVFAQIESMVFRDSHEDVDDCRVKLAARAALDFCASVGHRQTPAIWPVTGHRRHVSL